MIMLRCHDNGNVGLATCVCSFMIILTQCFMLIVKHKVLLPEAGCYWLRVWNVAMTMIMLDYMCVQNFTTTRMNKNNL